jgi:hypothetical protein
LTSLARSYKVKKIKLDEKEKKFPEAISQEIKKDFGWSYKHCLHKSWYVHSI